MEIFAFCTVNVVTQTVFGVDVVYGVVMHLYLDNIPMNVKSIKLGKAIFFHAIFFYQSNKRDSFCVCIMQ